MNAQDKLSQFIKELIKFAESYIIKNDIVIDEKINELVKKYNIDFSCYENFKTLESFTISFKKIMFFDYVDLFERLIVMNIPTASRMFNLLFVNKNINYTNSPLKLLKSGDILPIVGKINNIQCDFFNKNLTEMNKYFKILEEYYKNNKLL